MTSPAPQFPEGGFRFLPSVFQYSAGVAALPGFAIERVRFADPLPLEAGFDAIEALLAARGRPLAAFCACELRSPEPFSEAGFLDFNRRYASRLERWGVLRDGVNPVARTNVCPLFDPPDEPSIHAFCLTFPAADAGHADFVIAGGGEAKEGGASYRESIVRLRDPSTDGLRAKVRYVVGEMARRLAGLGHGWRDATSVQAYTVRDLGPLVREELFAPGVARDAVAWHLCRPPVVDIEFEMDVRACAIESRA